MNVVERLVRKADKAQQGVRPLAFVVGVCKKFGDDRGGSLAALLTFYGFLSLFPLLLLLVTILGFFGGSEHSFVQRVENSAFSQFPVVGTKLSTNIHGLHDRSVFGLVVGILFVLWGSQGAIADRAVRPGGDLEHPGREPPELRGPPRADGLHDRRARPVPAGEHGAGRARHHRTSRRPGPSSARWWPRSS